MELIDYTNMEPLELLQYVLKTKNAEPFKRRIKEDPSISITDEMIVVAIEEFIFKRTTLDIRAYLIQKKFERENMTDRKKAKWILELIRKYSLMLNDYFIGQKKP